MDIHEMPAGPELDALIECRVFGEKHGIGYYGPPTDPSKIWSHIESVRYDTAAEAEAAYIAYWTARYPTEESRHGKAKPDDFNSSLCYWKDGWGPLMIDDYSTDIAAAWLVVEKMRESGLRPILMPDWGQEWMVSVYKRDAHICDTPWTPSVPEAICRAALMALDNSD